MGCVAFTFRWAIVAEPLQALSRFQHLGLLTLTAWSSCARCGFIKNRDFEVFETEKPVFSTRGKVEEEEELVG